MMSPSINLDTLFVASENQASQKLNFTRTWSITFAESTGVCEGHKKNPLCHSTG